jgi:hypothetical protein
MDAKEIAKLAETILVPAAEIAAPLIGGATLQAIIQLAAKYGPEAVADIIALFSKKGGVTPQDVIDAFAPLKAYAAYGIPDKVPAPANRS